MANKEKLQIKRPRLAPLHSISQEKTGAMRATPLIGKQTEEPQKSRRISHAMNKNTKKTFPGKIETQLEKSNDTKEMKHISREIAQSEKKVGKQVVEIEKRVLLREEENPTGTMDNRLLGSINKTVINTRKHGVRKPQDRQVQSEQRAMRKEQGKRTVIEKSTKQVASMKVPRKNILKQESGTQENREKIRNVKADSQAKIQIHVRTSLQTRRKIVPPVSQEEDKPVISQILTLVGKKPATLRSRAGEHVPKETLRVIPLGGMCEIGKNMTAYEYGNDIIIVDCGQVFPDETMPGIDTVIPDFTYVLQNKDRVRGIFITHGHEDHIGGLPFLMQKLNAPLYAGRMTVELLKYKLDERIPGLAKHCHLTVVPDGDIIKAGCFSVEFIHVNHSIADAFMFAIHTPIGVVIHSGDFKIDYTPVDGEIMDLQRIAQLGREGVLLYLCESTNIEVPGFTKSERHVGETLAQMFEGAEGRIFVATFSSNTSRLQQILTAAERHGRKVALVGRSMLNVFNAANNLGYIRMKKDTLIDISEADNYPPEEIVIISTGSQGEPMSALTRIAFSNHRQVELRAGDTVIISATPIPGNEKPIYKVINELYRRGCRVYYSALADVHVSGHASREELKLVHELIRPHYFIPAHGETRMLYQHAEMAHGLGTPYENIFILANGDIFEIGKNGAKVTGFTNGEAVLIDGSALGEVDNTVLQERRMLGDDGVVSAALAIRKNGELSAAPSVCAMGFLYESEHEKIEAAARQFLTEAVERAGRNGGVKETVESGQMASQLRSFLYSRTKRRPVAMINLIEVP